MILLKRNSKLFNYHQVFKGTTVFKDTLIVGADTASDVEPVSSVACTCFSVDKVKSGETGKFYDHNYLWTKLVQSGKATPQGASPQDAFSVALGGQKVVPTGEIDTSVAYFQCELGEFDFFTNVKSVIQSEYNLGKNRPVACGTYWYEEYNNTFPNGVLKMGVNRNSAHEWVIVGWDADHPNMFKIDAHQGYYLYMPQDVFNHAMDDTYGSVALTLAETTAEKIQFLKDAKIGLLRKAIDWCYNLLQVLQARIFPPMRVINPLPPMREIDTAPNPPDLPQNVVYDFSNPVTSRHSVRVICDEQGLSLENKNLICAVIQGESGFDNNAKNENKNSQGIVTSSDWGLCQINDRFHIGQNLDFPTVQYVLDNPNKAVEFMIRMFKAGKIGLWCAYSNLSYKRYL